MDSKGTEIAYVADCLRNAGVHVLTVDVGTLDAPVAAPDVDRQTVAASHPAGPRVALEQTDRGCAVTAMGEALVHFMLEEFAAGRVAGMIGIGGSGGTALITPAMQALPIGLPKLMVSTVAAGNVAPYVGSSDVTMMCSVVDVAGLNRVSRVVLANAAHAMAGMVSHATVSVSERPCIGMTMFGVTTPCVTAARQELEARGFDCLVFHATGVGGQAMEKLVASGLISGVLDITTTEVADELVGGVFRCGAKRFDALVETGIPLVVSFGALDMVNFGAADTVPAQFRDRKTHVHNSQVTLMRTTADENRKFGRWIAEKLNRAHAPFTVLIPENGVSGLDAPGQAFADPAANEALFREFECTLVRTPVRRVERYPLHINDAEFARALVDAFLQLVEGAPAWRKSTHTGATSLAAGK